MLQTRQAGFTCSGFQLREPHTPGITSACPPARRNEGRRPGTCFRPQQELKGWECLGSRPRAAPRRGAREDPPPPGRPRGREARGRRPGAWARRSLGPTRRPPTRGRYSLAGPARPGRPPHLAAAPSSPPGRRSGRWRRRRGGKGGRRETRKGRREG